MTTVLKNETINPPWLQAHATIRVSLISGGFQYWEREQTWTVSLFCSQVPTHSWQQQ